MKFIYVIVFSLMLCSCSQNNIEGNNQPQNTTPNIEQMEPVVTTTTTVVTTTAPKVTTTIATTTTPVVKEPITEYMGIPIIRFSDDSYLETDLFKPFVIDGRFQSVGDESTLYVWHTHCTDDNLYYLPMMPGGRVGCTLLNENATNEMVDVKPFLEPSKYGDYTYTYSYGYEKSKEIDSLAFAEFVKSLDGYIQFPDYFMYYQQDEMFTLNLTSITISNKDEESITITIDTILENGFIVSLSSSNEDIDTFIRLYVPKENPLEYIENLFQSLK